DIEGVEVKTSALSSRHVARKVARALGDSIKRGEFVLSAPAERLPTTGRNNPMKQTREFLLVGDVMSSDVATVREEISIKEASQMIVGGPFDHLPVVSAEEKLIGMVTAWDISKAVASGKTSHISDMMTRKVFIASPDEPLELAARKLHHHKISALPVVDKDHHVIGMVTSDHLSRLYSRRRSV
ncbi:MAG TPA: CBS domain-containing protein, partial [Methanothrix sp.]|nr:CBS domain-containing protein [Methanothrix sp.]